MNTTQCLVRIYRPEAKIFSWVLNKTRLKKLKITIRLELLTNRLIDLFRQSKVLVEFSLEI